MARRSTVELLSELEAIKRINRMEQACRPDSFIALQVADKMPGSVEVDQKRLLGLPLLHAVLSEMAHAGGVGLADGFGRKRFRDSHQGNLLRPAACALCSAQDAFTEDFEVGGNRAGLHAHRANSNRPGRGGNHICALLHPLGWDCFLRSLFCSLLHFPCLICLLCFVYFLSSLPSGLQQNRTQARLAVNPMPHRGRFIAIEGIDGSGKRTQIDLLSHALEARGVAHVRYSFPRYESSFGRLVARYLNGEFGRLDAVDAHLSALLFAGDRFESKAELEAALAEGKTVLADRYIGSNLAHQTERVAPAQREEFLSWLKRLEYGIYGLPVEDLVLYLRVPAAEAHRLVGLKSARNYTARRHDLQEADLRHLEQAAEIYDRLVTEPNWVRIECVDAQSGALSAPEKIHQDVLAAVESRILSRVTAGN